jgi:hypothetical protein
MTTIAIHPIATRKAHYFLPNELIEWVSTHQESWVPGDKEGVFHCTIPKEWVRGEILTLIEGVNYEAEISFKARKGVNEDPRKEIKVKGIALPDSLDSADVILYSHALLGKDASSETDYEVIAVRGLTAVPNPRSLDTLLHNIFGMSGGTAVEGSAEEKLEMIKASFLFWKDKAMVG